MELKKWGKGAVSQAAAHVKNNHPNKYARLVKLSGGATEADTKSGASSATSKL